MTAVIVAVLGVLVLALGVWFYIRWRRSPGRALQRLVRSVSLDTLTNFYIPDGAGGEIHIDQLLLTPYGLMLLETKDMQGTVFAGERMDSWSATHNGARITFDNPIPMLQERAVAISLLAPGIPIESRVLFTDQAIFPKGHPAAVATLDSLKAELDTLNPDPEVQNLDGAWQAIRAAAVGV
jgi:nuclease-like protein